MLEDILTIVSNLGFLIPFAQAVHLGHVFVAFDLMAQLLFSMVYHTCNSFSGYCLSLSPTFWRNGDFFWAQYMIFRTALNLIHFRSRWTRPSLMIVAGVVIFFLQHWIGESTWLQFGVGFVSFGGLILYWIIYALAVYAKDPDAPFMSLLPPYRWQYVGFGFALSGLACSLYVTEMLNHRLYWAIHSVWHMDAALGQYFILLAWPPGEGIHNYDTQSFLAKPIEKGPMLVPIAMAAHRPNARLVHRVPPSRV